MPDLDPNTAPMSELIDHYRSQRSTLDTLSAPAARWQLGDDRDHEFRIESGLRYALDFIDVLLQRHESAEARIADLEDNS